MLLERADATADGGRARPFRRAALVCALALAAAPHAPSALARQQPQRPPEAADAGTVRPPTVNALPFIEFAREGRLLVETGKLGPDTTLDVTAAGEIDDLGGLKPDSVVFTWRAAGDEHVQSLARRFVTAVSQSHLLAFLRGEVKAVRLSVRADRQNVSVGLEGDAASEEAATKLATGYGALLLMGQVTMRGKPEAELYRSAKIDSDGRLFRVRFEMSKVLAARAVADLLDRRGAAQPAAAPNQ